jgi:hypothetical protein
MEINRREFIVVPAAAMAGSLFAATSETFPGSGRSGASGN